MGRSPCCEKAHTNKGAWSPEEDQLLLDYILRHGQGCWRSLPKAAGLLRCGKSCRLRWMNYLRPDLKRGNFTDEEDELIIKLHCLLGNKWSLIAGRLPGRTDNEIKNYWNTHIKRKLLSRGVNPQTHRPLTAFGAEPTTPDKPKPELKMTPLTNPASILPVLETSSASQSQIIDFGNARCPDARFSGGSGDSSSMEGGTCSSGTTAATDDGGQLNFRESRLREKEGVDLELSIGLLGFRSKKANSNACSLATQELELVAEPPAPAPGDTAAVKGVCLCWQLGFQGGQLCKRNCQTAKIVL